MSSNAVLTPVPRKRSDIGKKYRSISSEKETPTVVFASSLSTSHSPRALSAMKCNVHESAPDSRQLLSRKKPRMTFSESDECDDCFESLEGQKFTNEVQYQSACSVIQIVLECGIASVCRLRKIFPMSFFTKMEVDGTTVTGFNEEFLKSLCASDTELDEFLGNDDNNDVKSLSPLTYDATQKLITGHRDKNHRTQALEARFLLQWLRNEGAGKMLKNGKLARVIFGVSVQSAVPEDRKSCQKHSDNRNELVESYSFQIACNKPIFQSNIQKKKVQQSCTSLFRNLNGYSAGSSLSQVIPLGTQSSVASHLSSLDMSQKSLLMSMSQSVRAKVKKNQGYIIPETRYLTLRVDFTHSLHNSQLPFALRKHTNYLFDECKTKKETASSSIFENGVMEKNFVVTPLGKVAEESFSGLCVEMVAFSKEHNDDYSLGKDKSDVSVTSSQEHRATELQGTIANSDDESIPINGANNSWTSSALGKSDPQPSLSDETSLSEEKDAISSTSNGIIDKADDSKHLLPGAKAFAIPYGLGGNTSYFECIILNQQTTRSCIGRGNRIQYEVEFHVKSVKRKKQWIISSRIISSNRMNNLINSTIPKYLHDGRLVGTGRIILAVSKELCVCPKVVKSYASWQSLKSARKRYTGRSRNDVH